jgi:tetratricopeptide (TPR) repeat protein
VKKILTLTFCSLLAFGVAAAQTFEVSGQPDQPSTKSQTQSKAKPNNSAKPGSKGGAAKPSSSGEIGWGGGISAARYNRATEEALKKGNYAEASNFAERGVKEAPNSSRAWFLLGYTARLAGRTSTALQAYDRGLQIEPGSIEGLSGKAQTYMRMGKSDEAKALLLQVIAANPKRATDLAMAGELFMQSGDLPRAAELLNRAEAIEPNVHSEVLLAVTYLKLKQPARAKSILDRARARAPKNPDVFRAVATFYRESHDYQSAIKALQQIQRPSPEVMGELGYTYELAGMKKEAAQTYVKAANAGPRNLTLQLSAAGALIRNGDADTGRKYLAKAQAIDPNHYRLHALKADLAKTEKRTQEAIQEYNLALANLPEQGVPEGVLYPIQLHMNLSEQYRDAGDMSNATQQIKIAENAINTLNITGPARAEFLRMRASIKSNSGDFPGAEADLKEAMKEDPDNLNAMVQYAALLWRMKRPEDSKKMYDAVLAREPNNRFALESLGYLGREVGDNATAEKYFNKLRDAYPNDYVAYLALGELFSAEKNYKQAEKYYQLGYKFAPTNAQIVAGATNAAIEGHDLKLAGTWLERAKGSMLDDPRVLTQQERFAFFNGKYLESARFGERALKDMPTSRDVIVYLAYDLYNLGRYDDALRLVREKSPLLPKEANLPLLAGHVEKQSQLLSQAVEDYSRAIELDPKMADARVNRGYVLNDMQDAEHAADDFSAVLKDNPNHGVARLGLAFSELQMRKGKLALDNVNVAEKILGESGSTHLARATAYRQMRQLRDAEKEYRAALTFAPDDLGLHLALGDTLYHSHRYNESVSMFKEALALSPDDPLIYSQIAHGYAQLRNREETLKYVNLAEQQGQNQSAILLNTGDALMTLGERNAAMQRFERALEAPDASRVEARLLIAKLFMHEGHMNDSRQQVSLAFAESRIGEASPVTADNLIEAANLFTAMHDFDLAERYFERAKDAGASDQVVAIGLANSYLAHGEHQKAEALLAGLGNPQDFAYDYDYSLAMGNLYRERRDTVHALSMFARANSLSGEEDDVAERGEQQLAGEEGLRLNQKVSVQTDLSIAPIFEDATIYIMDQRINGGLTAPPRSSLETRWTSDYRIHKDGLPMISGFFQMRNARGQFSVPAIATIVDRDTYDYTFNGALNPILRMGRNYVQFNTGVAYTLRRDKKDPFDMNQNLFRQFVYLSTNSFANWMQVVGHAIHEAGPFTELGLHSRDLGAGLEFRVGHPWANNTFVTGYTIRDLRISPLVREFFQTSSYVGWEHRFGDKAAIRGLGNLIRGWRVQDTLFGTGQILRPSVEATWKMKKNWQIDGAFAFSRGQGATAHFYDNAQSGFFISYVKPLSRSMNDGTGSVPIEYPLRFSVGVEQQDFFNATGRGTSQFRPVVRLSFF